MRFIKMFRESWNDRWVINARDQCGRPWALVQWRAILVYRLIVFPISFPLYAVGLLLCVLSNFIACGRWEVP